MFLCKVTNGTPYTLHDSRMESHVCSGTFTDSVAVKCHKSQH
jgi:hypothetical protein